MDKRELIKLVNELDNRFADLPTFKIEMPQDKYECMQQMIECSSCIEALTSFKLSTGFLLKVLPDSEQRDRILGYRETCDEYIKLYKSHLSVLKTLMKELKDVNLPLGSALVDED